MGSNSILTKIIIIIPIFIIIVATAIKDKLQSVKNVYIKNGDEETLIYTPAP